MHEIIFYIKSRRKMKSKSSLFYEILLIITMFYLLCLYYATNIDVLMF